MQFVRMCSENRTVDFLGILKPRGFGSLYGGDTSVWLFEKSPMSKKLWTLRNDLSRMTINIMMKSKSAGREKAQNNQERKMKEAYSRLSVGRLI